MATFIPSFEEIITNQMEKPTEGEVYLLGQLKDLPDDYEIYFQSHINVAHPDIVILRKNCGVVIIEVKDWNLSAYEFEKKDSKDEFGVMREKSGHCKIRNPFEQAASYRDELYKLYSSGLYLGNLEDKRMGCLVNAGVYFFNATEAEVENTFGRENTKNKCFSKYYRFWARDSKNLLNRIKSLLNPHSLFSDEIYEQIKLVLTPSLEWKEQSEMFVLSKEQKKYEKSQSGKRQKIKGVAGSGKTLVLAARAVNCYKRVNEEVLILTFNITLKHYIRDKISQITRDLTSEDKKHFHIVPIFDFAKQMLEKYDIPSPKADKDTPPSELLRMRFEALKKYKARISFRYQAILIDEVQDFEFEWLSYIEELFLGKNGELVLFGDEKQNVYNRSLDEETKLPRTKIAGPWSLLKESYRLTRKNCELAYEFQKEYFEGKYETAPVEYVQMTLADLGQREELHYYRIKSDGQASANIWRIIEQFQKSGLPVAFNDICVLSDNCAFLRELDYYLRCKKYIASKTVCETKEEYDRLCRLQEQKLMGEKEFESQLYGLRRVKKIGFRMNPGVMKLSTIQSFKGWEINTIVLILDKKSNSQLQDELIYTAITRAKKNLLIINMENERYDKFFAERIKNIQ